MLPGWGVQIYDANATNGALCSGSGGLVANRGWDTYQRIHRPCNSTGNPVRHCDYIGDVADEDWTCDCRPRTAPPTPMATMTTTTTATTHTAMQDSHRQITALLSVQAQQQASIQQLTATVATLTASMGAATSTQQQQTQTIAQTQSRITAALNALPAIIAPPVPTTVTCDGSATQSADCTPTVQAVPGGGLNINARGSRVYFQGSTCSVDPCDLRESLRQVIGAFNNLG